MPTHPEDRSTVDSIRHAVADRYSDIGTDPGTETVIPTGRVWAEPLGYPADILSDVPQIALQSFTGIGAPLFSAQIRAGERLLDLGCGAGLDSLLAAQAVGPTGHVYGVDLAPGMVASARKAVKESGVRNVTILGGAAEAIPLPSNSVDLVLVNGLFNLAPDKPVVARELARVLRSDGRLVGAEIVVTDDQPPSELDLEQWFR